MHIELSGWMNATSHTSKDEKYFHKRLRENIEKRPEILAKLKAYIQDAHRDAQNFFEGLKSYSLDPLEEDEESVSFVAVNASSPHSHYPGYLPMNTLKGYFGEVLAGLIAEHYSPFGDDRWKVPAYLFRYHDAAFQYLQLLYQKGYAKREVFGRTGDDCLAFTLKDNEIEKILYCEAKCTKNHEVGMLKDAYAKFNESVIVSIYQVIHILEDRLTGEAKQWREALTRLMLQAKEDSLLLEKKRYNFLTYVHGELPVRKSSWIPESKPPKEYKANQSFEAVEIYLHEIEALICMMYDKEVGTAIASSI